MKPKLSDGQLSRIAKKIEGQESINVAMPGVGSGEGPYYVVLYKRDLVDEQRWYEILDHLGAYKSGQGIDMDKAELVLHVSDYEFDDAF